MTAKFCWWDLNTKDKGAAKAFYTGLFGWTVVPWKPEGAPAEMPVYDMLCIGERPFGGVNEMPADAPAPAHWIGHVAVDELDERVARAKARGAQFPVGVMTVPTVGRMAIMVDPQGCACSLFAPQGDMPNVPEGSTHGMVGWNELMASEVKPAMQFYTDVVGWTWRSGPFGDEMEYYLFGTGEEGGDAGGMMPKDEQMPMAAWFHYFTTHDIDATVAKARELGGTIIAEPFPVPTVGRLAVVSGPDGSAFGLAQWEMQG